MMIKRINSLTAVPIVSKEEEEVFVDTVGDLVEIQHHVLSQ